MKIDTTFNVYSDSQGEDPDKYSKTLKKYHKLLWNKQLPNGKFFDLRDKKGGYLEFEDFSLGSDAITHSYKDHKQKSWLTKQIPNDVNEIFNVGSTIGGYIIFPNTRIDNKSTINAARGRHPLIDDRFDLTLECIRLFYLGQKSPLYDTLLRYKSFFDLFVDFQCYIKFFLLEDLVENDKIKFYLPFNNFKTKPMISSIDDYLLYKKGVINFIRSRNKRIEEYSK